MKERLEAMGFTILNDGKYELVVTHPLLRPKKITVVPSDHIGDLKAHRWLIYECPPEMPGRAEAILKSREALIRSLEAA